MKNKDKTILAVMLAAILGLTILSQHTRLKEAETARKWAEFEKCIDPFPSDGVCDSCYKAIFKNK